MEEDLLDKTPKLKKSRPEFEEHNEEIPAQNASCMRYKQFPNKDKGESSEDLQVRGGIFVKQKLSQVTLKGTSITCHWHFPQVSWSLTSLITTISEIPAQYLG